MDRIKKEIKELSLLFDISLIISKSKNIKDFLLPILQQIAENLGLERGTITILNRNSSEIYIEEAYSMTDIEKARGKYKIGEGIIGKVVETGQSVVLSRISQDRRFLNRTQARNNINTHDFSFICVPIKLEKEILGTLSVDKPARDHDNYDNDIRLLSIIGTMLAQAVKARQEESEELARLQEENLRLQDELRAKFQPANIIGSSNLMQDAFQLISKVANTDTTVLIRGESGVGKELFANAIHYNSPRANKSFIKVNCSALPESLIESELFGHEKGAFTGAEKMRKGRFELADRGTLFLDEIGDLPLATQVKILRILQEKELERLGGSETFKVDVRIITATNRELEDLIDQGKFRDDLFYRLNVFPIYVPSLKERKSDITLMADHFIAKFNQKNNTRIKRIATSAIDMLMSYHWPGNVRELENCIERACILCNEDVIYGYHLPPTLQTPDENAPRKGPLKSILNKMEKELIQDTLKMTSGNISQAAEYLGITERMMGIRLSKYQIDAKRFKNLK
ncbi:MAG: sigma-54 interaction domain-containing protein [Candidatus Cyclobacteriaceae bacterium M3_2C_046]